MRSDEVEVLVRDHIMTAMESILRQLEAKQNVVDDDSQILPLSRVSNQHSFKGVGK